MLVDEIGENDDQTLAGTDRRSRKIEMIDAAAKRVILRARAARRDRELRDAGVDPQLIKKNDAGKR